MNSTWTMGTFRVRLATVIGPAASTTAFEGDVKHV